MPDISAIVTGLRIARDTRERRDETLPREVLNETRLHVGNGVFGGPGGCSVGAVNAAIEFAAVTVAVDAVDFVGPEPQQQPQRLTDCDGDWLSEIRE